MDSIQLKDFLKYKFLSDLKLSPDGKTAAYMQHACDLPNDGYVSYICVSDLNGDNKRLTDSGKKSVFCWDSNDKLISGIIEGDSTAFTRLYLNGSKQDAFTLPVKVKTIEQIEPGLYLISARIPLVPHDYRDEDCFIVTDLPIQSNGIGYISGTRNSLFIFDEKKQSLISITPKLFETTGFTLCKKQGKIIANGHEYEDKRIIRGGLYCYDIVAGEGKTILEKGRFRITWQGMIDDNVIFAGTEGRRNSIMENPYFYTIDPQSGSIEVYAGPDFYIGGLGIGSDCRYGSGTLCKTDNDNIYFSAADNGSAPLYIINGNRECMRLTNMPGSVDCFDVADDKIVFIGMLSQKLQELYMLDKASGSVTQLSNYNGEYTRTHKICVPEPCYFTNDAGLIVSGWVLKPSDYDESKRYPAILDIHGGPKTAYGTIYVHEMQLWASMGYFVFFCNPRGSDGHGDAYSTIMGINGSIDYDDIMGFTDHVLEKYPAIDPDRIGVTGGSYGGYMTNWIVGHTDRFACAATQRSIGDWIVHEYACDTGYWISSEMFPPNAIENPEWAWDRSPGKYSLNIKTPLLFIHSDQDLRCPLSEAMAVYAGAVRAGSIVRMVLFHGENHELSRSGKPVNRIKRLEEITEWFEYYLKGGLKT